MRTEHNTVLTVMNVSAWVDLATDDEVQGSFVVSLTPKEARQLSDKLLHASQRVEDQTPHGNS